MRSQSKNDTRLTGKVVVDAMGSDNAPHVEIDGSLAATRDTDEWTSSIFVKRRLVARGGLRAEIDRVKNLRNRKLL